MFQQLYLLMSIIEECEIVQELKCECDNNQDEDIRC